MYNSHSSDHDYHLEKSTEYHIEYIITAEQTFCPFYATEGSGNISRHESNSVYWGQAHGAVPLGCHDKEVVKE